MPQLTGGAVLAGWRPCSRRGRIIANRVQPKWHEGGREGTCRRLVCVWHGVLPRAQRALLGWRGPDFFNCMTE
eukprot:8401150-Pyramimonas_sp.AAC.1